MILLLLIAPPPPHICPSLVVNTQLWRRVHHRKSNNVVVGLIYVVWTELFLFTVRQ